MDKVINLGIPHVGELIFESIDTPGLIKCLEVSETWKVLAEGVREQIDYPVSRWEGFKSICLCKIFYEFLKYFMNFDEHNLYLLYSP